MIQFAVHRMAGWALGIRVARVRLAPAGVALLLVGALPVAVPCRAGMAAGQQDAAAVSPSGKPFISPVIMAGHCTTMVSPNFPRVPDYERKTAAVVLRVVISKTGAVSPLYAVSGPPYLEQAAKSAVRLWKFSPYTKDQTAIDVTTELKVPFDPDHPGGMISHPTP